MATIAPGFDIKRYGKLLLKSLPRPIESDDECARLLTVIEPMMNKELSPEENSLFRLLVGLVQDYENRTIRIPPAPPDETLRYLLETSGMRQTELSALWGTSKSYTSAIVNGKRPISKAQAKLLAEKFKVSVDLFL